MKFNKIPLSKICSKIGSGKTPLGGGSAYKSTGIPLIRSQNVLLGSFKVEGLAFIDEFQAKELRNVTVTENDILLNITGDSTARVCIAPERFLPAHVNQHVAIIRTIPEKADSNYLFYILSSQSYQNKLLSLASSGATRLAITKEMLDGLEIELPDLTQQKKVGLFLRSIDKKIEFNQKINTSLEQLAQTIFKSWFVDFDPVHAKKNALDAGLTKDQAERAAMAVISGLCSPNEYAKNKDEIEKKLEVRLTSIGKEKSEELKATASLFPSGFEESELGDIPKGWKIESLDSNIQFLNGVALQKYPPKKDSLNYPILKIAQLQKGKADGGGFASKDVPSKFIIKDGDIVFSWSATLMVKIWTGGECALNQHLFKVTSLIHPKWFQYLWSLRHLENFIRIAKSKATTMGHIQRQHLTDAKVVVPSGDFTKSINKIFTPLLESIIINDKESQTLSLLRDSLLPKLLAGEINLDGIEIKSETN